MNNRFSISSFKQITRILFPGILFLCCLSCKNDPKEIEALTGKTNTQLDHAHDVTFVYSEHGKVKARLFAHDFIRNEEAKPPYTDLKNGLFVENYNDSEKITSTISARYARYYESQQNVLLRDSIVVKSPKGETLKTEELVWNQSIHRIYTEKFVTITTPTQILYGDGLEANEDFTWYKIKNIRGNVQVNKAEMPQ
jgi:LPS export ABC transporter protein LptC